MWREVPVPLARSSLESDHAWAWDRYAAEAEVDPNSRCYVALTAYERRLEAQGAIIYRIDAASPLEPGRRALYLHFLSSAPRSRSLLMKGAAVYRSVGEGLVLMAMLDSLTTASKGGCLATRFPARSRSTRDCTFREPWTRRTTAYTLKYLKNTRGSIF
jgi:hypothetical protein